jgi:hypothetical protein
MKTLRFLLINRAARHMQRSFGVGVDRISRPPQSSDRSAPRKRGLRGVLKKLALIHIKERH